MDPRDALHRLAARAGVSPRHHGWRGDLIEVSDDALLAVLRALGHDVGGVDDAPRVAAAAERAWWRAGAPPVVVSWDGEAADLPLRVRADLDGEWTVEVELEGGERAVARGRLFDAPPSDHALVDGHTWCLRHVRVEPPAPAGAEAGERFGYHRIRWAVEGEATAGDGVAAGVVRWIAAPARAWGAPGEEPRSWGVFAPLHALRSPRSGAAGDLGELRRLADAVAARGGRYVATLPLLAGFLDEPCEPSPYAPASRRFWNELYLDLARAPGLDAAPEAQALLASPGLADERARLAAEDLVDYRAQYRWRRDVMDRIAEAAWRGPLADELVAFARAGAVPDVADYAAFRAIGEAARAGWAAWPDELRDPPPGAAFTADDVLAGRAPVDRARWQTHVWAQWAMDAQLASLDATGTRLYLDLPVGVNRDAWEVWRRRDLFVLAASTGAPPDALFLGGQDWGLPPLHPERIRQAGWDHVIACVRHHMRHAGILRIDHVMGLHRLYWVPAGLRATEGVYVHYAADELYAILALESHRHLCALAGEDLGTVPDQVRPAMRRHGMAGLYVGVFAMPGEVGASPGAPGDAQVASLGTHDTPTFAGWWRGCDIDDKQDLGLIDAEQAAQEKIDRGVTRRAVLHVLGEDETRAEEAAAAAAATFAAAGPDAAAFAAAGAADAEDEVACRRALVGLTRWLAATDATVVLTTLEDAWLEPRPQNVPGTAYERPNWRRPFILDTDAALADPRVAELLDATRRR